MNSIGWVFVSPDKTCGTLLINMTELSLRRDDVPDAALHELCFQEALFTSIHQNYGPHVDSEFTREF